MIASVLKQKEERLEPKGRVEDFRLLTGRGRFVDDLNSRDQAYMGLVLSPVAHAKIKKIDLSRVSASPQFIAALTGEDLLKGGVQPISQNPWPAQTRANRYHLAVGTVRFAGEPVVAILVKERNSVEDLLEQVDVEYEQLPVVLTIEDSKKCKALVYDDWENNLSQSNEEKKGDADKAIGSAPYVVQAKLGIRRQESAPIEPHAVLVSYNKEEDKYEVLSTVQTVHGLQRSLASELRMPKSKFHVRVMDMGGGFGSKGSQSYPWPLLACLFARRTGFSVKWAATRNEEFLEAAAGRDVYCDATLACNSDGRIVALKGRIECDVGVSGTQSHMASLTMWTISGPYSIPNVDLVMSAYVTNKMPIGPVRGAGAPEGCYFIERLAEIMSKKISLDPMEFRRRNLKKTERATDFQTLLDALSDNSNYSSLKQWRNGLNSRFREGSYLLGGIGISVRGSGEDDDEDDDWSHDNEESESWENKGESDGGNWSKGGEESSNWHREDSSEAEELSFLSESARVVLDASGIVTVYTGSSPHGQGHETVYAQLASEELGVPIENVRVVWGDTQLIPLGVGTFASRSAATGGSAVVEASRKVRSQLLENGSRLLGIDAKNLGIRGGHFFQSDNYQLSSIEKILERSGLAEISADSTYTLSNMSFSSSVHLCAILLDAEIGKVRIERYTVVEDCGRILNKSIIEGQLHGGVVHGIGGSLLERLAYDDDGNLLTTTFMDYSIPTSTDCPYVKVELMPMPSLLTLSGAKGVGESGTIASYGAVMNALNDALFQIKESREINIAPALPDAIFETLSEKKSQK